MKGWCGLKNKRRDPPLDLTTFLDSMKHYRAVVGGIPLLIRYRNQPKWEFYTIKQRQAVRFLEGNGGKVFAIV